MIIHNFGAQLLEKIIVSVSCGFRRYGITFIVDVMDNDFVSIRPSIGSKNFRVKSAEPFV